jgi:hypothetical protein
VITDDEVMRLFERADPARLDVVAPAIDAAGYLDALRTNCDVPNIETYPAPARPTGRDRWRILAVAAAAGVLIIGSAIALAARDADGPGTEEAPVASQAPEDPTRGTADVVATGFIDAYGAFDVERANTYLADQADISELISSPGAQGVEGTPQQLPLLIALLEAQGYEQTVDSCEELGRSAAGTRLRCPFEFALLRSAELGRGPFRGSSFELTVRDGVIVRASMHWGMDEFLPQMWDPFATWVSTAYPEDSAVMYEDEPHRGARLTEESIRLWARHSRDYVEAETAEMVDIAERFTAARNAYDAETAMSLLADEGVAAQLCDQSAVARWACMEFNPTEPHMGQVPLNHEELALAFEAERLLDVRYEAFTCEKDSGSFVTCTYRMATRLRRIAGYPPIESSFRLSIEEGRIRLLSFPWLNIGFGPGGYHPAESERFVQWLDSEHPEALDTEHPLGADGPVFRAAGQELIVVLTRASLDLLAGYLDEYESTAGG